MRKGDAVRLTELWQTSSVIGTDADISDGPP